MLVFDEAVQAGSGNINITNGANYQSISVTDNRVSFSTDKKTVTINPFDFAASVTVAVTIPEGTFTDLAGNKFTGTTGASGAAPWSFTTAAPADKQAPKVNLSRVMGLRM